MKLYSELAEHWQDFSPTHEYAEEAAFLAGLLRPARTVLELGSGGGNVAWWLKSEFQMTLTDLSPEMLAMSARQNPDCEHIQGDMRTLALDRKFDAVLMHDAVMYMTTLEDLRAALSTAKRHADILVVAPDHLAETFQETTEHGGEGSLRWLEWVRASGEVVECDYILALLEEGGVRTVVDRHQVGIFPRQTWIDLLAEGGWSVSALEDPTGEGRRLEVFRCVRS